MSEQSSSGQKLARAASAAVNIARGAATGGVYGAAVEATKSFLPELVRLAVVLLFVVILVPMLVFTALPNVLFGYSSATDQEIIDFTSSARELESIYQTMEVRNESVLDRLISTILPNFWTEGEADYDDFIVTKELGNTNRYWLMAIGSVRFKQDLYIMDETAVESLLFDKLSYTTSFTDRHPEYLCQRSDARGLYA